jgi:hypothetical protein
MISQDGFQCSRGLWLNSRWGIKDFFLVGIVAAGQLLMDVGLICLTKIFEKFLLEGCLLNSLLC